MLDSFKDKMKQLEMLQRLMKDENFKAFISHPKVQSAFQDPELKIVMKTGDMAKISAHPRFAELMSDPEVAPLLAKINPGSLFT